jgi:putative ABC transport system ATP-binding protein
MSRPQNNANNGAALIQLREVVKDYPTPTGPFRALHGITFDVQAGEFLAIIGKSGSGKTTLINMISGVDRITTGEVMIGPQNIHHLQEHDLARWRGNNLGIVYQSFFLLPGLSLLDNVMLPMDFCGNYARKASKEKASELLVEVGLEKHMYKHPSEISGGQQQRVAIARALANDPSLILADEPTGRLDSKTAEHVFEIFSRLVGQGKTIVMVTHDDSLARKVDRIINIQDGEVCEDEQP